MYELCNHFKDAHGDVVNAIKCIISNHDIYCQLANQTGDGDFRSRVLRIRHDMQKSVGSVIFYPYLNEFMNDTQFVNIINNNTNDQDDICLQSILLKWMMFALEEYKDIEMIKKIATVFEPKINVYAKCMYLRKKPIARMTSWMGVLMTYNCEYLTKYFHQKFGSQMDDSSSK